MAKLTHNIELLYNFTIVHGYSRLLRLHNGTPTPAAGLNKCVQKYVFITPTCGHSHEYSRFFKSGQHSPKFDCNFRVEIK